MVKISFAIYQAFERQNTPYLTALSLCLSHVCCGIGTPRRHQCKYGKTRGGFLYVAIIKYRSGSSRCRSGDQRLIYPAVSTVQGNGSLAGPPAWVANSDNHKIRRQRRGATRASRRGNDGGQAIFGFAIL